MTPEELQKLVKRRALVIDEVLDLFANHMVSPEDGEFICMWIAGLSAGYRLKPITGDLAQVLVMAWQFAVGEQGD